MRVVEVILTDKQMEVFSIVCKARGVSPESWFQMQAWDDLDWLELLPENDPEAKILGPEYF